MANKGENEVRIAVERYGTIGPRKITVNNALIRANQGIRFYLARELKSGHISQTAHDASLRAIPSIQEWLTNPDIHKLSPNTRTGIIDAIIEKRWSELVDAHNKNASFGTAGIRGKSVGKEKDLNKLFDEGVSIPMLKGPNWINDLVVAKVTQGIMNWMDEAGLKSVMIGYDSRAAGHELAELVAKIAIANEKKVYLFDKVSPFPALTYGITLSDIRADVGILISASHNVAGDNGYKITVGDGSQFDSVTRKVAIENIGKVIWSGIKIASSLNEARQGQLIWLGGNTPVSGKNYHGREATLINVETRHVEGMRSFVLDEGLFNKHVGNLKVGHAAFNGAGAESFPRMLRFFGLDPKNIFSIGSLSKIDGRFPAFDWGQQPDPGGIYGARIAVREFINQYGKEKFEALNMLAGTDPDADRFGAIFSLPQEYQEAFEGTWYLPPANLLWAVLADYRLSAMARLNGGKIPNREKLYGMISHTTSPWIADVAKYHGIQMKGRLLNNKGNPLNVPKQGMAFWVGFNEAAENSSYYRGPSQGNLYNVLAAEESNGFSVLGGAVLPGEILGQGSWVRDKDGTFAGAMMLEVLAYLTENRIHFLDYVAQIAKQLGYYMGTHNEPLPHIGQWVGPAGTERKKNILKKAEQWAKDVQAGKSIYIDGKKIVEAILYPTGKYDKEEDLYLNAPDQGVESTLEDGSSLIIRPSGTGNNLRFYTYARADWPDGGPVLGVPNYLAKTNKAASDLALAAQRQIQEEIGLTGNQIE